MTIMDNLEMTSQLIDNIKLQTNGDGLSDEEVNSIEDTLKRCGEAILKNNPNIKMHNGMICGPLVIESYRNNK